MRLQRYLTEADMTKTWISKLQKKMRGKAKGWPAPEDNPTITTKGNVIKIGMPKGFNLNILVKWIWKQPALANKVKKIADFGRHIEVELK